MLDAKKGLTTIRGHVEHKFLLFWGLFQIFLSSAPFNIEYIGFVSNQISIFNMIKEEMKYSCTIYSIIHFCLMFLIKKIKKRDGKEKKLKIALKYRFFFVLIYLWLHKEMQL